MDTPIILAFDTASAHCAVAVFHGQSIVASAVEPMAKGQAERLLTLAQELLAQTGTRMDQLTAIGVGIGPGNFTGIRIAVSAARGLAMGLGIPAIGVDAFEALHLGSDGPSLCTVDARRDMVFIKGFQTAEFGAPELRPQSDLPSGIEIIGACGSPPLYPVAHAIAHITASKLSEDHPAPAPLYLRPADAAPARDKPPIIVP